MIAIAARWHLEYRVNGKDWHACTGIYESYEDAALSEWYLERVYGLEIRIALHEETNG